MANESKFLDNNTHDFLGLRLNASQLSLGKGTQTASATAGAATLHQPQGKITSEALTTAAAANYTLTLTNEKIVATDLVFVSVAYGTATAGTPVVSRVTPAAGSVVIVIKNDHASAAFDGTLVVSYFVVKG